MQAPLKAKRREDVFEGRCPRSFGQINDLVAEGSCLGHGWESQMSTFGRGGISVAATRSSAALSRAVLSLVALSLVALSLPVPSLADTHRRGNSNLVRK